MRKFTLYTRSPIFSPVDKDHFKYLISNLIYTNPNFVKFQLILIVCGYDNIYHNSVYGK